MDRQQLTPRMRHDPPTRREMHDDGPKNSPRRDGHDPLNTRVASRERSREEVASVLAVTSREIMAFLLDMRTTLSAQAESLEVRLTERLDIVQQQCLALEGGEHMNGYKTSAQAAQAAQEQVSSQLKEIHYEIIKLSAQNMGLKQAFLAQQDGHAAELELLHAELMRFGSFNKDLKEDLRRRDEERDRREMEHALHQQHRHSRTLLTTPLGSPTSAERGTRDNMEECPDRDWRSMMNSLRRSNMSQASSMVEASPESQASITEKEDGGDQITSANEEPERGKSSVKDRTQAFHHAMGWKKPRLFGTPEVHDPRARTSYIVWLSTNPTFQLFCNLVVVTNVIMLAMETNDLVQFKLAQAMYWENTSDRMPATLGGKMKIYLSMEWAFLIWMTLELIINLAADRGYRGINRHWNIFDSIILFVSAVQTLMDNVNLSFLRVARVGRAMRFVRLLRIAKIMKIMRLFRYLHSVRKMILSMIGSSTSLFWALFLMFLIMFMISVGMLQGIEIFLDGKVQDDWAATALPKEESSTNTSVTSVTTVEREDFSVGLVEIPESHTHLEALNMLYGNIFRTMLTLFAPISGGAEWAMVAKPVGHISGVFTGIWMLFVSLMLFGVLNILTGIFVDAAMAAAQNDRDNIIEKELEEQESVTNELRSIFETLDRDKSGHVSDAEFAQLLQDKKCLALFSHLGLHPTEAAGLFKLLDEDESGSVAIDEFISGCIRLKGGAKAVDMITLLYENKRLSDKMHTIRKNLGKLTDAIEHLAQAQFHRRANPYNHHQVQKPEATKEEEPQHELATDQFLGTI